VEVTAAVPERLRRGVLGHRRVTGHASGVAAGRSRPAGGGRAVLLRLGRPARPRRPGAGPVAGRDARRPGVRARRSGSVAGPAGRRLPGGRGLLGRGRRPGEPPGGVVRAGGQGAVPGRRPGRNRAGRCGRRRRGVGGCPALRRRRPGGRPRGAADPPSGPPARPDRPTRGPPAIPGCRAGWVSTGPGPSGRPAWPTLPSRPGRSGTSSSPGSTRSRWSWMRPATRPWRRCRARPASTCRWPGWSTGWW